MSSKFYSGERLKSRKQIGQLFSRNSSSVNAYPLRLVYAEAEEARSSFPFQAAFVVPKRKFKKAVDRNLIKRRVREAYRLQKHNLVQSIIPEGKATPDARPGTIIRKSDLNRDEIPGTIIRESDLNRDEIPGTIIRESDLNRNEIPGTIIRESDLNRDEIPGTQVQGKRQVAGKQYALMFIYTGKEAMPYKYIERKMKKVLEQLFVELAQVSPVIEQPNSGNSKK